MCPIRRDIAARRNLHLKILPALSPPPPPPPQPPNVTIALANDTGLPTEGGPAFSTSDATLTGTASPGGTVTLTDGSTALGSAVADAAGNWSFSPGSGFAQGGHYITASETNASGRTGTGYLSFDYDTIAPPAPSAPQLALGGNVADTANPTFSGTAEANDEVLLSKGTRSSGPARPLPTAPGISRPGNSDSDMIASPRIDRHRRQYQSVVRNRRDRGGAPTTG